MPALSAERERQLEDAANRGEILYESQLRDVLERDHMGEIVAIHPDSGDFVVARYRQDAIRQLQKQHPKGLMFLTRIGPLTSSDLSIVDRMDNPFK